MKKYVSPELEILKLNVMDVIRTSPVVEGGTTPDDSETPGTGDDDMGWG